eukprot:2288027-Rhodomonas_salina.5
MQGNGLPSRCWAHLKAAQVSDQFQRPDVGATSAPPLRVAPAGQPSAFCCQTLILRLLMVCGFASAGDVIVGHTENCNCSTMVEAVWYLCWEEDSRTGGRIYARTGQQSWNGPIVVPENSTLHVIGPTSAQLCGQVPAYARTMLFPVLTLTSVWRY